MAITRQHHFFSAAYHLSVVTREWNGDGTVVARRHAASMNSGTFAREMGDHAPSPSLTIYMMPGREERSGSAPSIVSLRRIIELSSLALASCIVARAVPLHAWSRDTGARRRF
jgi:hypothetical protein